MNLHDIARALGGEVTGGQVLAPGPNHSAADRSLAIRPSHQSPFGFIAHSHAGDDWRTCRDYVLDKLGMDRAAARISKPISPPAKAMHASQIANHWRDLWQAASDPRGTIVETYLASRALDLPEGIADDVLRFHPQCPWRDENDSPMRVPAMLALFRLIEGNVPVAIHRTALTPDGRKVGRKMLGPVKGAAIKLDPDEAVTVSLAIGEGTETCLAARQLGFRPCWALGSVGAIASFPVLPGIETIIILGETDDTGASAQAVKVCGQRWHDAGREVLVVKPRGSGDLNDVLRRVA